MSIKENELVQDFEFNDLLKAYYDCRKRKRNTLSALDFELHLEQNLLNLFHDLKKGNYKIGRYICFVVTSPKPREVWAANFRDRIVHHLVYNAIKDRFYKRFIKDTYSCIPKRGTLAAAKKMLHYARSISCNYKKKAYFLKADLSNFFVSIDKDILFELLCKNVQEQWLLDLLRQIIYHDPRENVYIKSSKKLFGLLPKHKSLWHNPNTHGLPIGNLTSQFFSNVYLDVLDQYIKQNLKCKYYCRYVDDFIILSLSPHALTKFLKAIEKFANKNLKLCFNPRKCYINILQKGMDFVGYFVKPHRLLLRRRTILKIIVYFKNWYNLYNRFGTSILKTFSVTVNSFLGMLINTKSFDFRYWCALIFNSLFVKIDRRFSKSVVIYGF